MRSGAMRWEDRPLFYDIYSAFPPLNQNKFMDEAPNVDVREIFYTEDTERA
jgi:small subunit ribosomal protein S23